MQIYKTRWFDNLAKKQDLNTQALEKAQNANELIKVECHEKNKISNS
jgi:hypothetical protein